MANSGKDDLGHQHQQEVERANSAITEKNQEPIKRRSASGHQANVYAQWADRFFNHKKGIEFCQIF
jgi:hypothetical protein